MSSKDPLSAEEATSRSQQKHDYIPQAQTTYENDLHSDSDTTATNSSDEFDWDQDESLTTRSENIKAKRGRALWIAFMQLARAIRVLLIGVLGAAIFITPLLVVELRFKDNHVSSQVHVWSLWLSIVWAASCITYLLVDAIPRAVIWVVVLFGGQVERLKVQLEVCAFRTYAYARC